MSDLETMAVEQIRSEAVISEQLIYANNEVFPGIGKTDSPASKLLSRLTQIRYWADAILKSKEEK